MREPVRPACAVSVIVPVYNSEAYIASCLRSVLQQDLRDIEVIVVDDGSTDRTPECVQALADERVRYIVQANSGSAVARNRGLDEARGEFIAFCDSDDLWAPRRLAQQVAFLRDHPETHAVVGAFEVVSDRFDLKDFADDRPVGEPDIDPSRTGWAYLWLLRDSIYHLDALLVRRNALADVRFDPQYRRGQDFDFLLKLSQLTRIVQLTNVYAFYRQHGGNITKRPHLRNYRAEITARAVERWGLSTPDGTRMSPAELRSLLGMCWFTHGWELYHAGWYAEAARSFGRAIGIDPKRLSAYRYWMQATLLRPMDRMPAAGGH
jgi:glycosyltransferase involved in cell wall biosynthesis